MATPTSRATFKQYCLRSLGSPVIKIEVSDEQVDDRVDEALKLYFLYHEAATQKVYYKYQLQQVDIDNSYITLPDGMTGAVEIFDIGDALNTQNIFSIRYQIALNDLYTLTSVSMVPYYMALSHLELLQELLVGSIPIRYNRETNILYFDASKYTFYEGEYIVVTCYQEISPDDYAKAWLEPWFFRYTTALIKQQWGSNLSKYSGAKLLGGIEFNGQKIRDDAAVEIEKLREELITQWSTPLGWFIGAMACFAFLGSMFIGTTPFV